MLFMSITIHLYSSTMLTTTDAEHKRIPTLFHFFILTHTDLICMKYIFIKLFLLKYIYFGVITSECYKKITSFKD